MHSKYTELSLEYTPQNHSLEQELRFQFRVERNSIGERAAEVRRIPIADPGWTGMWLSLVHMKCMRFGLAPDSCARRNQQRYRSLSDDEKTRWRV